jgi:hypothetical protein
MARILPWRCDLRHPRVSTKRPSHQLDSDRWCGWDLAGAACIPFSPSLLFLPIWWRHGRWLRPRGRVTRASNLYAWPQGKERVQPTTTTSTEAASVARKSASGATTLGRPDLTTRVHTIAIQRDICRHSRVSYPASPHCQRRADCDVQGTRRAGGWGGKWASG